MYFILLSPNTQQDHLSIKTFEAMADITLGVDTCGDNPKPVQNKSRYLLSNIYVSDTIAHTTHPKKTTGPPKILIYSMIIENLKNLWGNILLISDT